MPSWFYKLERKIGKYAIGNLMMYIVIGQAVVFLAEFLLPDFMLASFLTLSVSRVMAGEVWRVISFIFVPASLDPLWTAVSLYFYYIIGTNLEKIWNSFKFNVFYLLGCLGAIAAAFITGNGTNFYINLSLVFAFAILVPDFEVTVFFLIRVKIKWVGILNFVYHIYLLVVSGWSDRAAIIVSLLNVLLFFGKDIFLLSKRAIQNAKMRGRHRAQRRMWDRNQRNQHR